MPGVAKWGAHARMAEIRARSLRTEALGTTSSHSRLHAFPHLLRTSEELFFA